MLSIRDEFYADIIVTAIENYGTASWFIVNKYNAGSDDDSTDYVRMPFANIEYHQEGARVKREVNEKTFSPVFTKIRNKKRSERDDWEQRMFEAYIEVDAGNIATVDALGLLEMSLFGEIVYS